MNASEMPLVSVVIPTYNHAHFLGRVLQSVLEQTYTNWEVLIIDNHSKDNTYEVVDRFEDPRITLQKIHNNGVIAVSRNMGVRIARGEWIAFLDSDDWWAPNKLQVCFEHVNDTVDLIYHDLEIVTDYPAFFQRKKIKSRQVKRPVIIDLLVNGNMIANSSVVVRKKLLDQIGGIDESSGMIAAEDYNAWLHIAQITEAFSYIPRSLGYYLFNEQGVSRKDMTVPIKYATSMFTNLLNEKENWQFESALSYMKGRYAFKNRDFHVAREEFLRSMLRGRFGIRFKSALMLFLLIFSK